MIVISVQHKLLSLHHFMKSPAEKGRIEIHAESATIPLYNFFFLFDGALKRYSEIFCWLPKFLNAGLFITVQFALNNL